MKLHFNPKYLLPRLKRTSHTRFLFFFLSDVLIIILSLYASFLIRFDLTVPDQYKQFIPSFLLITLIVLLPIFILKRLYHFTWVYVSIDILISVFNAVTYGFLFLGFLLFIGRAHYLTLNLPRSIVVIDYVLVFIGTSGIRVAKRVYYEMFRKATRKNENKPRLIIIGAGDAGEQLIRSIKQTEYPFTIAGILDDSDIKQNTSIHGVYVLGRIKDLPKISAKETVASIIIALPSASSSEIKQIVATAQEAGVAHIKTLPSLASFINRNASVQDIRDIDVEDLLGRKKVSVSLTALSELIAKKTVLITGAAGSIGFELIKQIYRLSPAKLIACDMDETGVFMVEQLFKDESATLPNNSVKTVSVVANILHKEKIGSLCAEHRPDIVFHAAAYKHVRIMEREPDQAILTNIAGTWNVIEAAREAGVKKFVLISTDKAVNPSSVMGMTKRVAEMLIMYYANAIKCVAVRFGNVLGSRGSVVPLFKQQILSGGPITITHPNMQRYFMVPSEAILLVLEAAAIGKGGEIFVLDMGSPVKIITLAETMISLAGLEPYKDIPIIFTKPSSGEKLFEELLTDKEHVGASTEHEKIFIAKNHHPSDTKLFFEKLQSIITHAKEGGATEMLKAELTALVSAV